jgi:dCMP deaminase
MDKHIFYLDIAKQISQASYCKRNKVGALIVKDDNIISFGFNGTIKGFDNVCEDEQNNTTPYVLHAESNAITKCAKSNYSSIDACLYTTTSPCIECAKLIIQSGIKEVYYIYEYRDNKGINLLKKAGINVWQLIY